MTQIQNDFVNAPISPSKSLKPQVLKIWKTGIRRAIPIYQEGRESGTEEQPANISSSRKQLLI